MKNLLILLFFCSYSFLSFSQTQYFVSDSIMNAYMESGYSNKHFIPKGKTDRSGQRQGKWKDYTVGNTFICIEEDGIPKYLQAFYLVYAEGNYVNGKREGLWKNYILEDKTFKRILQSESNYINGLLQGEVKFFFVSGELGMVGSMRNDLLHGDFVSYYKTGEKFCDQRYSADLSVGKHLFYNKNGTLIRSVMYKNDQQDGETIYYYPNGKIQEFQTYSEGKLHGPYRYYYENGQLWIEKIYENDKIMNVTGSFDKNGNPRDHGTIINGNGTIFYYTEEGVKYATVTLLDGVEIDRQENGEFH